MAFRQLVEAVPFFEGLTLDELGGRGVRWPEREQASAMPAPGPVAPEIGASSSVAAAPANGALRLGTYRPIWADPNVEISPALHFTVAHQQLELSPEDAGRLGVTGGETVQVAQNGTRLKATAAVRSGVPTGTAFLADGIATDSANELTDTTIEVSKS
jgi:NADH-quinone oxidoreductase subunit G